MAENLRIWSALEKTDPKHTKQFKRGGGFSGTAIKPIWSIRRLTELFGACGTGWGMGEPSFQLVPGANGETLVYCTVSLWYTDNGQRSAPVVGIGGDKVTTWSEKYAKLSSDDEAFKKAFTDALMNAAKQIGVGADVHMGLFDDSKYVRDVAAEFDAEGNGKPPGNPDPLAIYRIPIPFRDNAADWTAWVPAFAGEIKKAMTVDVIRALEEANAPALDSLKRSGEGGKTTHGKLTQTINARKSELMNDPVNLRGAA